MIISKYNTKYKHLFKNSLKRKKSQINKGMSMFLLQYVNKPLIKNIQSSPASFGGGVVIGLLKSSICGSVKKQYGIFICLTSLFTMIIKINVLN